MPLTREEIAADLVWRYVEHVRETSDAETLSAQETRDLLEVMLSVAPTAEAVAAESEEARRAAVRNRVQAVLAAGPPPAPAARKAERPLLPGLVPAWRFRAVCAASVALAATLATVGWWHHPPERVVRVAVPREIPHVEGMDEATAHVLLPRMVRNELAPAEERNLMGHMLVCPGCFDEYIHLKQQRAGGAGVALVAHHAPVGTRTAWLSNTPQPPTGTSR